MNVESPSRDVLLIAAHGSSTDAPARERVMAHAAVIASRVPHSDVVVGFARGEPSLRTVVAEIAGRAEAQTLTVLPFMTAAGHYADTVLPEVLREAMGASSIRVVVTPPVGTQPRVSALLHRRALRIASRAGWEPSSTAIVLIGHGTPRHRASRDSAMLHTRAIVALGWHAAAAAFIDDAPTIADVLRTVDAAQVIVLPFLIGGAAHAAVDIPQALGIPVLDSDDARQWHADGRSIALDEPLGTDPGLTEIAADLAVAGWSQLHGAVARSTEPRVGTVTLVGAGPGAADLISVRGRRALRRADVVVYDRLIDEALLAEAPATAQLLNVGKWPHTPQSTQDAINIAIVDAARGGARVVRLKGGDPMVFGRGSEEVAACLAAGVPVEVIPGITSALAGPAAAGIAVTSRHVSRSFAVITAATATDVDAELEHMKGVASVDTIVVLMGRARLGAVCAALVAAGRSAETPVACIERATLPGERVVRGTLATIAQVADAHGLDSPMVTVIGPTAG